MAKLTSKQRDRLGVSEFAGPDRSYPINDPNHARNALARAAQHASPSLKAEIRAKVKKKFPQISIEGDAPARRADRARRS